MLQKLLAACVVLLAGASLEVQAADAPATLPNGLVRAPNAKVALAYVRPGTNWTKYKTVELSPLVIPPKVRNAAPNGTVPEMGESYVLRDKDVAALQSAYDTAMRDRLGKAGFTFVTTAATDTLVVAAQVTDIKLNAPIEDTRLDEAGPGNTFSQGGGGMVIAAVFADGATGQVVAEAEDNHVAADIWGINNRMTNLRQARETFDNWASELARRLTETRAGQ